MRPFIIITYVCLRHLGIAVIERLRRIIAMVAVMMIGDIGSDIRLIVRQINRFRTRVVRGIIVIVIGRNPRTIGRTTIVIPHRRTLHESRTHDIIRSIEIAITNHLDRQRIRTTLRDDRSHILEDRRSETSLNEQGMVITLVGLDNTQIINPSVVIEVEIVNHIPRRIE